METVARRLGGEEISFSDEVELCYGVRPRHTDEAELEAVHEQLDEILPGDEPLSERYQAWREANPIEVERLKPLLEGITEDLRGRTRELFELPAGEQVELEYVTAEPWTAFNYYLGGLRSRVVMNTDVPMVANLVLELMAHEVYPGHHTEHSRKEETLARDRGYEEETIHMVGTPQGLISEGIAGLAVEIVVEDQDALAAEHLAGVGIEYDAELAASVRRAREPLDRLRDNAALLIHEGGMSSEDACDYLEKWGLMSHRRADHALKFILDPVWRSYVSTYTDGYELCRTWVDGDPERFERLLTEQLTPADLAVS